ncbi:conserved exported hypothetical protein [Vibrio crassostreae]|uniref:Uncharacterized protein n=1 Tax=Vibrio crassostreae TaxID=246167 RepID=A0A4R2E7S1_9VIBR|nr:hypothetical protein [Vibrio crassostreae]MDH5949684.1 hypothetical protein [Vibrio crassostreae]ROO49090.1 hypothetical protein EDB56_11312 [Vibrio crassostreae]ROO71947.1 hypothetical protein EDB57_2542 [Vibrio crassostreae]ROO72836.1 hypothetical protein EDB64_2271 [Vibrio crassostreae]ROO73163.1 hypothetical protein EDB53_1874 [Vibrio crassostreae]
MNRIVWLLLLIVTPTALACNFHQDRGRLFVPNYPAIMLTLPSIIEASESNEIAQIQKPHAMINWLLSQKLNSTMPVEPFTFYQVVEGHYSSVTGHSSGWLSQYQGENKPKLGELMILSELSVFNALLEQQITIEQAFDQKWITINGPKAQRQAVKTWLTQAFNQS